MVRPDLIVVFVLSLVVFARAVYVPSSPQRTLALGLVVGLPLPFGAYARFLSIEPTQLAVLAPVFDVRSVEQLAWGGGAGLTFSWLMSVLLATGASRVIYGLRREAREARRLGQYTLEEKLGEGGMGVVYRARHAMLRRPTAVKLLPPDRAGEASLARFEREVQLTAGLTHPNTVTIFDYGRSSDGVFYYAMELLDGASLESVVAVAGPLPARSGRAHPLPGRQRPLRGAPGRVDPPRHQARQHHPVPAGGRRRRPQGRGLRAGQGPRARHGRLRSPRAT